MALSLQGALFSGCNLFIHALTVCLKAGYASFLPKGTRTGRDMLPGGA